MRLVHPDFLFPLEFKENEIFTVVIEKPALLVDTVTELKRQIEGAEGQWALSEGSTVFDMKKSCEMILDPFSLQVNNRKMLNALYDNLEDEFFQGEGLLHWNECCSHIYTCLERIAAVSEYDLSYIDDIQFKDFLKFGNMEFRVDNRGFLEQLMDYFDLSSRVLKIKLFICVNLKSFLSQEQLVYLWEECCYKKYQLLLLEGAGGANRRLKGERLVIVDNDLCVIE